MENYMIKNFNELFNNQSFNDYSSETENNLPVGLKILETQKEGISQDEEKIKTWVSCYGLKLENFPTLDETNTLVSSEKEGDSSWIVYHLPFNGSHEFFFIKPNGHSHKLQCAIDNITQKILIYYPVSKTITENDQKI